MLDYVIKDTFNKVSIMKLLDGMQGENEGGVKEHDDHA
jgi:hypothetical protein